MALVNLDIAAIQGYTPTERAKALSAELAAICLPYSVRQEDDVTQFIFPVITHPTSKSCVLQVDTDKEIVVHPDNNLTNLIALMPALPQGVKTYLENLIKTNQTITFGQLLTGDETILTDEQMATDGWFPELEQT